MTDVTFTPLPSSHDAQSMILPLPEFAIDLVLPKRNRLTPDRYTKVAALLEPVPVECAAPVEVMGLAQDIIDYSLSVGWQLTSIKGMNDAASTAILGKPGVDVRFRVVVDAAYLKRVYAA
ncbi:hypothetical protein [Robbsia sp. KACC 23696]|uniref:hypothetical protein n=1 Tax=Robbsia sp. KACC 23696 TaxID=3149231 RepID=UPI00325A568D